MVYHIYSLDMNIYNYEAKHEVGDGGITLWCMLNISVL